jgi:hypothetical protein
MVVSLLFCKIFFTWAIVGIFYHATPPYFPIEISRCLASNAFVTRTFFFALAALPVAASRFDRLSLADVTRAHVITYAALWAIAGFDDVEHWALHMLGVALLGVGALRMAWTHNKMDVIVVAGLVYASRLVLKVVVLVWFEGVRSLHEIGAVAANIMYTGQCVSPHTLTVFKACGVLQWGVFVIVSTLY